MKTISLKEGMMDCGQPTYDLILWDDETKQNGSYLAKLTVRRLLSDEEKAALTLWLKIANEKG